MEKFRKTIALKNFDIFRAEENFNNNHPRDKCHTKFFMKDSTSDVELNLEFNNLTDNWKKVFSNIFPNLEEIEVNILIEFKEK